MTTDERMAIQRKHHRYNYARRLAMDKTGAWLDDFKLRAGLYGNTWKLKIWALRNEIKRERK